MKVLILPDAKNWSCDFTSDYIIKHLPHITFEKRYVGNIRNVPVVQKGDDFDVVWVMLHYMIDMIVRQMKEAGLLGKTKLLLGVRGAFGFNDAARLNLRHIDAIGVQSNWAYNQLREKIPGYKNIWVTYDGVDEEVFCPMPKLRPPDHEYIVGWAGQPRLGVKRFDKIKDMCTSYKTDFAECHAPNRIYAHSHQDMPKYYNGLSVLFHYSTHEGAPRPVIEAASCGLPVITSPTGYGQEIIDKAYHAHDDYNASMLLNLFRNNPHTRKEVGERNREEILKKWTWKLRAPEYERFFTLAGDQHQ